MNYHEGHQLARPRHRRIRDARRGTAGGTAGLGGRQAGEAAAERQARQAAEGRPGGSQGEEVRRGHRQAQGSRRDTEQDAATISTSSTTCWRSPTSTRRTTPRLPRRSRPSSTTASRRSPRKRRSCVALTEINYQLKNYDKAIDFGNRAIKGGVGRRADAHHHRPVVLPQGRLQGHPEVRGGDRRRPDQGRRDAEERDAAADLQRLPEAQRRCLPDARHGEAGRVLPEARLLEPAAVRAALRRPRATTPTCCRPTG